MVIDTSAIAEWLLKLPRWQWVDDQINSAELGLNAPCLIDAEYVQVIRRLERSGKIHRGRADAALDDFIDCPIDRYSHEPLIRRVWQLRQNLTAYDAQYVALGEALGMPLLTMDRRLAKSPGVRTTVICP